MKDSNRWNTIDAAIIEITETKNSLRSLIHTIERRSWKDISFSRLERKQSLVGVRQMLKRFDKLHTKLLHIRKTMSAESTEPILYDLP